MTRPARLPPRLSRRHYVFIAEAISKLDVSKPQRLRIAKQFAMLLVPTNPLFNTSRFIEAATKPAEPSHA